HLLWSSCFPPPRPVNQPQRRRRRPLVHENPVRPYPYVSSRQPRNDRGGRVPTRRASGQGKHHHR
uniref:Uncharacterized protein n=1 Tax=Aegilops tauschii subsp. strangulata TaxID=200361 RepID=A0A453S2C2_AEGTS